MKKKFWIKNTENVEIQKYRKTEKQKYRNTENVEIQEDVENLKMFHFKIMHMDTFLFFTPK